MAAQSAASIPSSMLDYAAYVHAQWCYASFAGQVFGGERECQVTKQGFVDAAGIIVGTATKMPFMYPSCIGHMSSTHSGEIKNRFASWMAFSCKQIAQTT